MILKWTGTALILFSAGGMGLWFSWQWKTRLKTLENLRQMVYFLKGEITYSHAPLAEALERVGKRGGGALGELFCRACEAIGKQEGESFREIWHREIETSMREGELKNLLSQEDITELSGLGEHLGYLDVDMQDRTLLLYLDKLDLVIEDLRNRKREQCRLYTSLGIVGGMFLVILMY